MHGLEVIVALNEQAQREQTVFPSAEGWEVKLDSELAPNEAAYFAGKAGVIHVINRRENIHLVVDASDPHNETDLLSFHRNWKVPRSVAFRVEQLASQHRRMVCRAA